MGNPVFRELGELVGVKPLTAAQLACGLAYALSILLLFISEAFATFGSRKQIQDAEKQEKEPLNKTTSPAKSNGEGEKEPTSRSFLGEFWSAGLWKCLQLQPAALLENRQYIRAAAEFGTLIAWFFIADRTSMLPVGSKSYTRDTFFFIYGLLVVYSFSTWKREWKTPVLLNRSQTEEWKGWMQVLFLLYHYFEARELYNGIRVLIAAYVWMTGFGNFLYYYKTRNFCLGRFAEMMWRLNFLVFFCCLALNNSYMLYYICPMHTVYTVFVYATLAIFPKLNDNRWYLFGKIVGSFVFICVVWDIKSVFYMVWRPFGPLVTYTDPRRPGDDNMHEWYFRSGLDRYIWIFGMLCGFVHPYLDGLMTQVDAMSKAARYSLRAIVVAACAAAGMAWYHHVYVLPKLEYNAIHPYTSWIPISIWAFMRNLTPRMRVVSLGVFGWLGCITLETYMGQFHTWLSSSIPDGQPVGLLEIIPDYPLINFGVVTAVYVYISYRLFLLTNILKNAAVPGQDPFKVGVNFTVMLTMGVALVSAGWMLEPML